MTARPPRLLPQGSMLQIVVALGFSIAFAITVAWCPPQRVAMFIPPQAARVSYGVWERLYCPRLGSSTRRNP